MPSDELYVKHVKATEPDIGVVWHTPAGFTLADVRRLADTVRNFHERGFSQQQAALAPFASLLKEKNDG